MARRRLDVRQSRPKARGVQFLIKARRARLSYYTDRVDSSYACDLRRESSNVSVASNEYLKRCNEVVLENQSGALAVKTRGDARLWQPTPYLVT